MGGGPVLRASLGAGSHLGPHCTVLVQHYLDLIHECPDRLWEPPAPMVSKRGRQQRKHAAAAARKHAAAAARADGSG